MLLLALSGGLLELSWLLLWPLGYRLTHSPDFTSRYLASYPAVRDSHGGLQALLHKFVPQALEPTQELLVWCLVGVLVLAGLSYVWAVILLDRGAATAPGSLRVVLCFTLLFQVTLLLMPGIFTTDVFSYLMYGHLAGTYGFNPYITPPNSVPEHALLNWIHPMWHAQPTVYGPLWTNLGWALAKLMAPLSLVDQVLVSKLLINIVHAANLVLVWWLLERLAPGDASPRARLTAFTFFAWNPLLLFEFAGNGHNDALMMTFVLLGLAAVVSAFSARGQKESLWLWADGDPNPNSVRSHLCWLRAGLFLTLGALVKYTAVLVGVFWATAWARQFDTWRTRLAWIAGTGLLAFGLTIALFWPWLELPRTLAPLLEATDRDLYLNSVPDLVALTIADNLLDPTGRNSGAAWDAARFWMKNVTRLLFLAYIAFELRYVWLAAAAGREAGLLAAVRASTRAFIVLPVLLLNWVLDWYFTWPLALAALLGWRSVVAKVTAAYTLTSLPVFYLHHYWQWSMQGWLLVAYAGLPLLIPLVGWVSARRHRAGNHLAASYIRARGTTIAMACVPFALSALLILALLPAQNSPSCKARCSAARLVVASPAEDAVLGRGPETVQLHFTDELVPGQTALAVTNPARTVVSGPSEVRGENKQLLTALLPRELPDGLYTVRWRSRSAITQAEHEGQYQFVVRAEANTSPTLTLSRTQSDVREQVTVEGVGFTPSTRVKLLISDDEQPLGSTTTDSQGRFSSDVVVPDDVPLGDHAISAEDTSGAKASAPLLVKWGGWPPLRLAISARPGFVDGRVTFTVTGRNRSAYLLEHIRLEVPIPRGAAFVSATHGGYVRDGRVVWDDIRILDRTTFDPHVVTFSATGPVATHAWAEFRHEPGANGKGASLPAFVSNAVSTEVAAAPLVALRYTDLAATSR